FCSSNPHRDLDLVSELEVVLSQVNAKDWEVIFLHDVTVQDLVDMLRQESPDIVHFCGHSDVDVLLFVNPTTGNASPISPETFGGILRGGKPLQAVVLNACQNLAVLAKLRDTAYWGIGTTRTTSDAECIAFAEQFYNHLSANKNIHDAYSYALRRL